MNRQPFGNPPRWWPPKLSPLIVRWTRGYRRRQVFGAQQIVDVRIEACEHLRQPLAQGCGVLLTPNHSTHYDSNALYVAADRLGVPLYFMTAWQVFHMSRWWERWLMQRVGCFSVDRESNDRKAFGEALRVLREEPYPLVIFPEGDIYHTNDRVTQFREGAAAIALAAARKSSRPIVVVPCAIRFLYVGNPKASLERTVGQMEERLYLRSHEQMPLVQRIHRLAEASLALKELDVLGETRSGRVRDRIQFLLQLLLDRLEHRCGRPPSARMAPERVKTLRQELIRKADPTADPHLRAQWRQDMEDLFLAIQLYSYPGDYLLDDPSIERIAETVDKLEEDILLRDCPTVRAPRRVILRFGEPLPAPAEPTRRKDEVSDFSRNMQQRVQDLLDVSTTASPGDPKVARQDAQSQSRMA